MRRVLPVVLVGLLVLLIGGCCVLFNKRPVANFTSEPSWSYAGQEVRFNASSSFDPDGEDEPNRGIKQYDWNFGDGSEPLRNGGPRPTHIFRDNGQYPVTLTVYDRYRASDSQTLIVEVRNPAPIIKEIKIYDPNGCRYEAGDLLRFEVAAVDPASLEPKVISEILWDFGDGTTARGRVVEHCYSRGCRDYQITVTVSDDDGAITTHRKSIYIYCKDEPPTPIIQITPSPIYVGTQIVFDGSSSHDNDRCFVPCPDYYHDCGLAAECDGCPSGRIVSWRWWIKPPCQDWVFLGYGDKIFYTPEKPGTFRLRLEVRDDDRCDDGKICCDWVRVETEFEVIASPSN